MIRLKDGLASSLLLFCVFLVLIIPVTLFHGFPIESPWGLPLRLKNSRKLWEFFMIALTAGILLHSRRKEILHSLYEKTSRAAAHPVSIWVLAGLYAVLFFWQNATKYASLEINFIPYLFYDYMLWYFPQGKFCYTGFLHGYYHINLIMLLLLPVWKIFHSTWVLHAAGPVIASASSLPFFFWSRDKFKDSLPAFAAAFVFLNFRYLQNVLHVNFAVEIFYPLFIFTAVWAADRHRNLWYALSIFLGLLVKEDSVIYFGALGLFYFFQRGQRVRGAATMTASVIYALFILKVFIPWSGSTILEGDLMNYRDLGSTPAQILWSLAKSPFSFVRELFVPAEKTKTLFKLVSRLIFFPLLSPWFLLAIVAVYPLFFRSVEGSQFVELALYYPAPVLAFLFLAFVDGWKKFRETRWGKSLKLRWILAALLLVFNGFNLRPLRPDAGDRQTIALAESLPRDNMIVAQGHLLPYLGYRHWNFYQAKPYGVNPETRDAYLSPDQYFFDRGANPYPLSEDELRNRISDLKNNPLYEQTLDDGRRVLFSRKTS